MPGLERLEDRAVPAALVVTTAFDGGKGSLRDTISSAKDGDTIVFDTGLQGQTITLVKDQLTINKNLNIVGPGASLLTISGNNKVRVFAIPEGLDVSISGLTITQGRGQGDQGGGGVQVVGSNVTLTNDVFVDNHATFGGKWVAAGGALGNWNGATTTVIGCTFQDNSSDGVDSNTGRAFGGAIINDGTGANRASLTIIDSVFIGNQARGADGYVATNGKPYVGNGFGGAIANAGQSTLNVSHSRFANNLAMGGSNGSGGAGGSGYVVGLGQGGAISSGEGALVLVADSEFDHNQAIGGSNGTGGAGVFGFVGIANGGAISVGDGSATITNTVFDDNVTKGGNNNVGGGGPVHVGWGAGGAIANLFGGTSLVADNLTIRNNQASGGDGNSNGLLAGDGIGGGLANMFGSSATLADCNFSNNVALGGSTGTSGADGLGGAMSNLLGSTLTVVDSLLKGNQAIGGYGGIGRDGGNGFGGGLFNGELSSAIVLGSTINDNSAQGGLGGPGSNVGQGIGGGAYFAPGGTVRLDLDTFVNLVGNHVSTAFAEYFGEFVT